MIFELFYSRLHDPQMQANLLRDLLDQNFLIRNGKKPKISVIIHLLQFSKIWQLSATILFSDQCIEVASSEFQPDLPDPTNVASSLARFDSPPSVYRICG